MTPGMKRAFFAVFFSFVLLVALTSFVGAASPKLTGESADFMMKGSFKEGSGPLDLIGAFRIEWDGYLVRGNKGQLDMDKERLLVTEKARVEQEGENPLQLTADYLEMESASEEIIAKGNVLANVRDLQVSADKLEGGKGSRVQETILAAIVNLSAPVQKELTQWLEAADPEDQIFLLSGKVVGHNESISFSGSVLLVNAASEKFIFAGPTEIEYVQNEEGSGS